MIRPARPRRPNRMPPRRPAPCRGSRPTRSRCRRPRCASRRRRMANPVCLTTRSRVDRNHHPLRPSRSRPGKYSRLQRALHAWQTKHPGRALAPPGCELTAAKRMAGWCFRPVVGRRLTCLQVRRPGPAAVGVTSCRPFHPFRPFLRRACRLALRHVPSFLFPLSH